ncbi:hypothetical protein K3495_g10406, partial [Podosphaera aphanis]
MSKGPLSASFEATRLSWLTREGAASMSRAFLAGRKLLHSTRLSYAHPRILSSVMCPSISHHVHSKEMKRSLAQVPKHIREANSGCARTSLFARLTASEAGIAKNIIGEAEI